MSRSLIAFITISGFAVVLGACGPTTTTTPVSPTPDTTISPTPGTNVSPTPGTTVSPSPVPTTSP